MGRRTPFNRLTLSGKIARLARSFPADAVALDCLVTAIWLRRLREIRGQRRCSHTSSHPGDGIATPPQEQTTGDAPSSATTVAMAEQAGQK